MNTELNKTFTHKITIDVAFTMDAFLTKYDTENLLSEEEIKDAVKQKIKEFDSGFSYDFSKVNVDIEEVANV